MTCACGEWAWSYMCCDWLSLSEKVKTGPKFVPWLQEWGKKRFLYVNNNLEFVLHQEIELVMCNR